MPESHHSSSFATARVKTLVSVMFCYLFYYTGRQNFGFAIPGMAEELGLTKAQLGWCSSALLWSYAIGQAINGQLADRFGGRTLMSLGGMLSFIMNWITSFAGGLAGVMVPWAGNGFVQSMGWAPGSRILSNWWDRTHRGRVYGWYVFAAGMSSVVTYIMAATLVGHGWRWIFRGPVVLMLLGCLVFWLVVRERPSQAGFADLPDEEPAPPVEIPDSEADSTEARTGDQDKNAPLNPYANAPKASSLHPERTVQSDYQPERPLTWLERYQAGFRCVPFLFGCGAIGFQNLARYGLLVWVPVHFLGENWKDSPQKWVSVALPVGMALGAVSAGWISDRVFGGRRAAPVIIFLGIAALCASGMAMLDRTSLLALPLLFLTGFFVYGPQSAFWALCPDLLGKRLAGTGTGMMNCSAYLFAGFGEPLIGHLIETRHSTHMVFPVVAVACALGAILMSFIRKTA